jgi:hypothetical protein
MLREYGIDFSILMSLDFAYVNKGKFANIGQLFTLLTVDAHQGTDAKA